MRQNAFFVGAPFDTSFGLLRVRLTSKKLDEGFNLFNPAILEGTEDDFIEITGILGRYQNNYIHLLFWIKK